MAFEYPWEKGPRPRNGMSDSAYGSGSVGLHPPHTVGVIPRDSGGYNNSAAKMLHIDPAIVAVTGGNLGINGTAGVRYDAVSRYTTFHSNKGAGNHRGLKAAGTLRVSRHSPTTGNLAGNHLVTSDGYSADGGNHAIPFQRYSRRATSPSGSHPRRTSGAPSPSRSHDGTPYNSLGGHRLAAFGVNGYETTSSQLVSGRTFGLTVGNHGAVPAQLVGSPLPTSHYRAASSGSADAASNPDLYRSHHSHVIRRQGPGAHSERLGPVSATNMKELPSSGNGLSSQYLRRLPFKNFDTREPPDPRPELWEPEAEDVVTCESNTLRLVIYNCVRLPLGTLRLLMDLVRKKAMALEPTERGKWLMNMSAAAFAMFSSLSKEPVDELRRMIFLVMKDTIGGRQPLSATMLRGCMKATSSFLLTGLDVLDTSDQGVREIIREVMSLIVASPRASSPITRVCMWATGSQASDSRMRRRGGAEDIYYAPRIGLRGHLARTPETLRKKRYSNLNPHLELEVQYFFGSHMEHQSAQLRRTLFEKKVKDLVFGILLVNCQRYGSSFTGFSLDDSDCDMGIDIDSFIAIHESEQVPPYLVGGQALVTWAQLDEQKSATGNTRIAADIARYLYDGLRLHPDFSGGYLGRELRDTARKPLVRIFERFQPEGEEIEGKFQALSVDIAFSKGLPGVRNSCLLKHYNELDPRVKPLVVLVKFWSKARAVNGAFMGYLSSYAHTLTVIDFLQRVDPPVLPNIQMPKFKRPGPTSDSTQTCFDGEVMMQLSRVARDSIADESLAEDAQWFIDRDDGVPVCELPWANWESSNTLTVVQLLAEYFRWMALECPWGDCVISPRVAPCKLKKSDLFIANNETNFPPVETPGLPMISKSARRKRNKRERERQQAAIAAGGDSDGIPKVATANILGPSTSNSPFTDRPLLAPSEASVANLKHSSSSEQARPSVGSNWSQRFEEQLTEFSPSENDECLLTGGIRAALGDHLLADHQRSGASWSSDGDHQHHPGNHNSRSNMSDSNSQDGSVKPTESKASLSPAVLENLREALDTPESRKILECLGIDADCLAERLRQGEMVAAEERKLLGTGQEEPEAEVEPVDWGDEDEDEVDPNYENAYQWMYYHEGHTCRSYVQDKHKNGHANFHKICIEDPCENDRILQPFKLYANEQLVAEYLRAHVLLQAGYGLGDVFRELVPRNHDPQINDHIDWGHFRNLKWYRERYGDNVVPLDEDVIKEVRIDILKSILQELEVKGILQPSEFDEQYHLAPPPDSSELGSDVADMEAISNDVRVDGLDNAVEMPLVIASIDNTPTTNATSSLSTSFPRRPVCEYVFPKDPEEPLDEYWLRKPEIVKVMAAAMAKSEGTFASDKLIPGCPADNDYKVKRDIIEGARL